MTILGGEQLVALLDYPERGGNINNEWYKRETQKAKKVHEGKYSERESANDVYSKWQLREYIFRNLQVVMFNQPHMLYRPKLVTSDSFLFELIKISLRWQKFSDTLKKQTVEVYVQ